MARDREYEKQARAYTRFIVQNGKAIGGWEYPEDAKDELRAMKDEGRLGDAKIMARASLAKYGIDPKRPFAAASAAKHESGGNPYFYVVYQGKIGRVVESRRDAEDIARSDYEGVTRVVGRGGLRGLGLDPDRPSDWTSATSRSRASAARHERGGNPSTSGAKAGMRLVYLPVNAAWVFLFGDDLRTAQIITLSSEERFIRSRKDAVAAAKRHGLAVSKSGAVTASGPNPFAQEWSSPSSLHRLMKHESGGNPFDRELAARVKALVGGKK
jgi:hypothetical protein